MTEKGIRIPAPDPVSFGIELELLVAHLPSDEPDPDAEIAHLLSPLLRIDGDTMGVIASTVYDHVSNTFRERGIAVAPSIDTSLTSEAIAAYETEVRMSWEVDNDITVKDNEFNVDKRRNSTAPMIARGSGGYRWSGLEIRSPPMVDVEASWEEVRFVVQLLKKKYRVRVNASCGYHVHVGNGSKPFEAQTLRRAAGLLWMADPLLSRLHAPWRRVSPHATSVRLVSRLAVGQFDARGAQALVSRERLRVANQSRGRRELDPIPVLPWNDTSRQVAQFGSREAWLTDFQRRLANGPSIVLSPGPDPTLTSSRSPGSSPARSMNLRGGGNNASRPADKDKKTSDNRAPGTFTPNSFTQDATISNDQAPRARSPEPLLQAVPAPPSVPIPRDDENDGGAYSRRFNDLSRTQRFLDASEIVLGHREPFGKEKEATQGQLYQILIMTQCHELFDTFDHGSLPLEAQQLAMEACMPYVESAESVMQWDEARQQFVDQWPLNIMEIEHPRPRRVGVNNAPGVIGGFEGTAALLERRVEERGMEDLTQTQYAALLTELRRHVRSPQMAPDVETPWPFRMTEEMKSQIAMVNQMGGDAGLRGGEDDDGELSHLLDNMLQSTTGSDNSSNDGNNDHNNENSSSNNRSGGGAPNYQPQPPPPPPPAGSSPSGSNSDNEGSPPTFHTPPLPPSPGSSPRGSPKGSNGGSNSSSSSYATASEWPQGKLLPHDISTLPQSYKGSIEADATYRVRWERISFLPGTRMPFTPGATDPGDIASAPLAVTLAWAGLDEILKADSAAAVSALVSPPLGSDGEFDPGHRPNYNFVNYAPEALALEYEHGTTVEFREAGGTVDVEWVVTWGKICTGIMKWCGEVDALEYQMVLARVGVQVARDARGQFYVGGRRYDVCDFLDDLGLFDESECVKRLERSRGPPR
ncbi:putative amidoligase enzyme-domain-containing protein [Xylariaceae sp. FL0016]|nr:putative amidoligase enzyme-domain-containing protein [Xylariaceae sp. FL0016]